MFRRGDDRARIEGWIAAGALVRPRAGAADVVDLVRAIGAACGAPADPGADARRLVQLVAAEHVVFVLIDGLGSRLLRTLAGGLGFLAAHVIEDLHAVFPSTTAAVLTSLATGEPPAVHGITGWWTRLPECGCTAEILPFHERFSKRPLGELGVDLAALIPVRPLLAGAPRDRAVVTRDYIAHSTYSRWWAGGAAGIAYHDIEDGVARVVQRVRAARTPTWTHLYLNQLDALCHEQGVATEAVRALLRRIDDAVTLLRAQLPPSARVVVTADHGHIDGGHELRLPRDGELAARLECPPTGEPRAPLFHLAGADDGSFADLFRSTYGDAFALLPVDEAAAMGLFGAAPLTPLAHRRFGDYVALSPGNETLIWHDETLKHHRNVGVHGGMTADELVVPLIVA